MRRRQTSLAGATYAGRATADELRRRSHNVDVDVVDLPTVSSTLSNRRRRVPCEVTRRFAFDVSCDDSPDSHVVAEDVVSTSISAALAELRVGHRPIDFDIVNGRDPTEIDQCPFEGRDSNTANQNDIVFIQCAGPKRRTSPERGIDRHGDVETLVVTEPVEPVKTSGRPVLTEAVRPPRRRCA